MMRWRGWYKCQIHWFYPEVTDYIWKLKVQILQDTRRLKMTFHCVVVSITIGKFSKYWENNTNEKEKYQESDRQSQYLITNKPHWTGQEKITVWFEGNIHCKVHFPIFVLDHDCLHLNTPSWHAHLKCWHGQMIIYYTKSFILVTKIYICPIQMCKEIRTDVPITV